MEELLTPGARRTTGHAEAFGPFDGRVWINSALQGPLPRAAIEAAHQALEWKVTPARMPAGMFDEVPRRLRAVLARLLNVRADEIILGNSATHGLQQIAQGYPWQPGDEVLLVRGDFPASTLPWLVLERQGVRVRTIDAQDILTPEVLDAAIGPSTRIFCTTWVHTFRGHALDLEALGRVCRSRGVWFVVNAAQGLGALPLDARALPIDAVTSCGHKFLCGPYGTGVCWIRADLRDTFHATQGFWLTHVSLEALEGAWTARLSADAGARAFDVFAPANFFNFMTWTAALEYLMEVGVAAISEHDQQLVGRLIDGLTEAGARVISPVSRPNRSAIVMVEHPRAGETAAALAAEGIDVSVRQGRLRFSPHLHNTVEDIDRTVAAVAACV